VIAIGVAPACLEDFEAVEKGGRMGGGVLRWFEWPPLVQFLATFAVGVGTGVAYRSFKRGRIERNEKLKDHFAQFEQFVSIFNVVVLGGLLVGMVVSTRAAGYGTSVLVPGAIGFVSTAACLLVARAWSRKYPIEDRARAFMSATFGGGNRGFVLLLLLLAIFQVDFQTRSDAIAAFYLVDLGNFLALLSLFSVMVDHDFARTKRRRGAKRERPTGEDARRARILVKTQKFSLVLTSATLVAGVLADKIPVIHDQSADVIRVLSVALLFFSTFNLFSAVAGRYHPSRIVHTLRIFGLVRLGGAAFTGFALYAFEIIAPNLIEHFGFLALALLILYYAPPSSLADDIFAVNSANEKVVTTVKEDAALLNIFFVAVLAAVFFLVWFASLALHAQI
jgi:hypothetical protein